MTHETELSKSETFEASGQVLTVGCVYHPDMARWEPTVSVRPSWEGAVHLHLVAAKEEFQDTPGDAMDEARVIAKTWLAREALPQGWAEKQV